MRNTSVYYEEYIGLTMIFTKEYIGNDRLPRVTTTNISVTDVFFMVNLGQLSFPMDYSVSIVTDFWSRFTIRSTITETMYLKMKIR